MCVPLCRPEYLRRAIVASQFLPTPDIGTRLLLGMLSTWFRYAGPHGFLAGGSMDLRFFHRLGASNLARRPLCGGAKREAFVSTYGAVPLMRPEHLAEAQLILVWGNNVTVSQMHLMAYINAAPGWW